MHDEQYGAEPKSYIINFDIDLKACTFSGTETIAATIKKPTKILSLDLRNLEIERVDIWHDGSRVPLKYASNNKAEKVTITMGKRMQGAIDIQISFKGALNNRLAGLYRSNYGKEKYIATTQ